MQFVKSKVTELWQGIQFWHDHLHFIFFKSRNKNIFHVHAPADINAKDSCTKKGKYLSATIYSFCVIWCNNNFIDSFVNETFFIKV